MPYKNREQKLEAQRRHYQENKDRYISNQYLRRMQRAEWFFELKSGLSCSCGESHPACIQFHHRDPLTKEGEVSDFVNAGYSKDVILAEIAKCDVLCANCHLKQHWQERMDQGLSRMSPKYKADALATSAQVRGETVIISDSKSEVPSSNLGVPA